jgi:hypothetical protein
MARKFVTFAAASSAKPCTCAKCASSSATLSTAPAAPTLAPRVAAHEPTVPSPTLRDFVEGMKKAPVQRGGTK